MRTTSTKLMVFAAISCLGLPALAHHSMAMFDRTQKVEVTGVVTDVQWTNPHVWVELDAPGEDGETERWAVEFTSRVHLTRRGWTRTTINPGDEVTFTMSPYRDGRPGGRFWTVTLPSGETLRDPGAQREYELSIGAERLSVDPASQPQSDRDARRAAALQVDRSKFSFAELDSWPDFGGIWHPSFAVGGTEPKLKGRYLEAWEEFRTLAAADPRHEVVGRDSNCEPLGMPGMMTMPYSLEFLYTPGKITVQQEAPMSIRRIFMDGRELPRNPDPTYAGYSVGRWEGDTLVVETVGTRPGQRLGVAGITNGPRLKITERIYLDEENPDVLHLDFTFEDPDALAEPWVRTHVFNRDDEWAMLEYVCQENDRHPVNELGQSEAILED
ncbi:MAG: DUF6152 family protein [Gammaproteobacteria bacterium]|jgi:hypothetical protein